MKSFCVIGMGSLGRTIAKELEKSGHQVLIIDKDEKVVNDMADFVTDARVGDSTDENVLRAAGVKNYDCAVVCISSDINASILTTLFIKEIGVPKVIVRASNEHECKVLEKIGADEIVYPERDMGEKLAYTLDKNNVVERLTFSNEYSIVERKVPRSWVGRSIIELNVRRKYGINIIAISNSEMTEFDMTPMPDRVFAEGEIITLIGANRDLDKIAKGE